jgi:uncharacterized protein (DUF697 family)
MTRKRLPKAITRSGTDLREIAVTADEEAPQGILQREKIEPDPEASIPTPPKGSLLPSTYSEPQAARRRSLARKIVERHKMYAAVGGLFPLPAVNVAGVTAVILRMLKALSDLYEVPFERDQARSIVIGLMAGATPTGLAAATASTLALIVPGSGLFGLAVSSVTAASLTRGIGLVFVERFEKEAPSLANEGLG